MPATAASTLTPPPPAPRRRWWRWLAGTCAAGLLLGMITWQTVPLWVEPPALPTAQNRLVTDRNGQVLGLLPLADGYRHQGLTELPQELARCLMAAEDKRFYNHSGVDWGAVARAAWNRLRGTSRSGASTLTMQLAKLCNPPAQRNYSTKIKEALQARALEHRYNKQELLLAYLNTADFGNQCRGAEAAALFYFGKHAADLQTHEAALLAALVQAPGRLNPLRRPQAALKRRNSILQHMGADTTAPLGVAAHSIIAPRYVAAAPGQLTLDAALQRDIQAIAADEVNQLRRHNVSQAAVVVIDNRSGELLAAVPAAHPDSERGGQLNGFGTPRSAGSTLKPFVFLQAFGAGAWPGTIMADVPTLYHSTDGIRAPGNYNNLYLGPITIRQALACSQNIPAMEALNRFGSIKGLLQLLRSLGMNLQGDAAEYGLGLAIGNAHVNLLQLTHAYSTLARGGAKLPLRTHTQMATEATEQVLNPLHCYQIAHILSDPSARTATFHEASALSFPFRCAAKTGTSSDFRDNWCCGFTAEFTVGVWVGNFDNSPMQQVSGISGAGPIFHRVMQRLQEYHQAPLSFPEKPKELTVLQIDTRTGTIATPETPRRCLADELATPEQRAALPEAHLDDRGRAVLDARYAEWFNKTKHGRLFALDATAHSGRRPTILIPAHGTVVRLDPTLPHGGRYIELRSTLPAATTRWESTTLRIEQRAGKTYAVLTPGQHTLRASSDNGLQAASTFTVRE